MPSLFGIPIWHWLVVGACAYLSYTYLKKEGYI